MLNYSKHTIYPSYNQYIKTYYTLLIFPEYLIMLFFKWD